MARATLNSRLTSLAGYSNYSIPAAKEYVYDGVSDVVKHIAKKMPQNLDQFAITEEFIEAPFTISSGMVTAIKRKAGTFASDTGSSIDDYRPASKANLAGFERTKDPSSLLYQSKFNPVYVLNRDDNAHSGDVTVDVSPAISSDEPVQVSYVEMIPKGSTNGDSYEELDLSSHVYLENVPEQYAHLVLIYAAMKLIQSKMTSLILDDEDVELETALNSRYTELLAEYKEALGLTEQPAQTQQRTRRR